MTEAQKQEFWALTKAPALASDPILPPKAFDEETLRFHLASAATAGLTTIGLTINSGPVPSDAVLEFLGKRYRYWEDDTPHGALFDNANPPFITPEF